MGKYDALWTYISQRKEPTFQLPFEQIESIAGVPIDHSFLRYKKELLAYGFQVEKISLKQQTVSFVKMERGENDDSRLP